MDRNRFSDHGRLGAAKFWHRFDTDTGFRQKMHDAWQRQHFDRDQKRKAARKGTIILWQRYRTNPEFKKALDQKLRASRSRGGTKSLLRLNAEAFKRRLAASAASRQWPTYHDSSGNLLRSKFELRVANALLQDKISYEVEPRFVISGHAFYPDFQVKNDHKIIEVVGYVADWYWSKTAEKIRLITQNHPEFNIAIITRFLKQMKLRLEGVSNVTFFTPYQLDLLTLWCRGMPGFTSNCARGQSG